MSDVFVYRVELPCNVKGTTVLKDDDYIVFINSLLCDETQNRALKHELRHIQCEHLYDELTNVNSCEIEAG